MQGGTRPGPLHGSRWPGVGVGVTAKKEAGDQVLAQVIPPPRLGKALWEGAESGGQFPQVTTSQGIFQGGEYKQRRRGHRSTGCWVVTHGPHTLQLPSGLYRVNRHPTSAPSSTSILETSEGP